MPAGMNFFTTASTPCRVPAKYSRCGCLPSRIICDVSVSPSYMFTKVWCWGSYGNMIVLSATVPGAAGRRVAHVQAQRLAFAQNLRLRPLGRQPSTVGVELQARREERADG